MPYLLDTVIISELRKKNRNPQVENWFNSIPPSQAYLSAITIGEIENGIIKQQRINPAFATELSQWLEGLIRNYADNILPFTMPVARRWGQLCGELGRTDVDLMIAATALENRLTVSTRNVRHFEPTGVQIINPFDAVLKHYDE
jgi:predicted nucleic acid-binding protein